MKLCVIPARGGSKRLPRKNIRNFCGMPMIARSIRTALDSELFDHVVVSTDDEEIAEIAQRFGAATPFVRPAELADDFVGTNPVTAHAAAWFAANVEPPTTVCCLYATAPFVYPQDLQLGRDTMLSRADADFVFAAATFAFPVQRSLIMDDDGFVRPLFPDQIGARSQDLPEAVHDAGQFYWGTPHGFATYESVFLAASVPVLLPRTRVQDIDTEEDWDVAEALFRLHRGEDT